MKGDMMPGEANGLQDDPGRPPAAETIEATAGPEIGESSPERARIGWADLNDDVKREIYSKFTLRGLAWFGETCRENQNVYCTRLAHERASIIAVAEQSFGRRLFRALVTTLRRSMYGQRPCPGLLYVHCFSLEREYAGDRFSSKKHILLDEAGEPRYVTPSEAGSARARPGPCAVISEASAQLFPGRLASPHDVRPRADVQLQERWKGEEYYKFVLEEEALVATLGLLTAVYVHEPEARPASFPSPLNFEFWVRRQRGSLAGEASELVGPHREVKDVVAPIKEAKNLVAPVWSFVKSIKIQPLIPPCAVS